VQCTTVEPSAAGCWKRSCRRSRGGKRCRTWSQLQEIHAQTTACRRDRSIAALQDVRASAILAAWLRCGIAFRPGFFGKSASSTPAAARFNRLWHSRWRSQLLRRLRRRQRSIQRSQDRLVELRGSPGQLRAGWCTSHLLASASAESGLARQLRGQLSGCSARSRDR